MTLFLPFFTLARADEAADLMKRQETAAKAHRARYLAECPAGQIRSFWYRGDYFSTVPLDIDLGKRRSSTAREYYLLGLKNHQIGELTYPACRSLERILKTMPDSDELSDELDGLFIAWRVGERVEIRRYRRTQIPTVVRRIYDIGGAEVMDTSHPETETLVGRIIIPPLNRVVDGRLPMRMELKNTGKNPVRVCTLAMTWPTYSKENVQVLSTPDSWKSDPPGEEESAGHIVTIGPGATVEIPFDISNNGEKRLRIEAGYAVAPDFARKFDLWSGEISCAPVILVF